MDNLPITIKKSKSTNCQLDCDLYLSYGKCNYQVFKDLKRIILKPDTNNNFVTHLSNQYILNKIVLAQGYHKFNNINNASGFEVHLEHRKGSQELIVVAFVVKNDTTSDSKTFFTNVLGAPESGSSGWRDNSIPIGSFSDNAYSLYPGIKSFYKFQRYNKTWIVLDNSISAGSDFFNSLVGPGRYIGTQDRQDGVSPKIITEGLIYSNNTRELCNKNYGDTMKCYTDAEFRKQCGAFEQEGNLLQYKNKYMLIVIIFVIIFVILILIVLYIYEVSKNGVEGTSKDAVEGIMTALGLGDAHKKIAEGASGKVNSSVTSVVNIKTSGLIKHWFTKFKSDFLKGKFPKWLAPLSLIPGIGKGNVASGLNVLAKAK